MMKRIILASLVVLAFAATAMAQTGREIAQKVKDRPDGDTRQSELVMKLVNKRGAIRERKLISYSIDVGAGNPDKDDDRWLYLPAMKKTRRISGSSAKQDYFMGSDFTYDDMSSRNVDEDSHQLLGEETIGGHKCWKLEYTPKDKREIYSRKVAWIRQDCLIAVKVEYYDKMGKLHRRLELSDIVKVSGFWIAKKLHMTNVQTNHQTILEFKDPKFNTPMNEAQFSVSTLEKGRF